MRNQNIFAKNAKKMLLAGVALTTAFSLAACSAASKDNATGSENSGAKTEVSNSENSSSSSSEKSETSSKISPFTPNKYGISVSVIENYLKSLGYKDLGKNASDMFNADGSIAPGYMTDDHTDNYDYGLSYQISGNGVDENGNMVIFSLSQLSTNEMAISSNAEVGDWVINGDVNQQPLGGVLTNMSQLNLAPCP